MLHVSATHLNNQTNKHTHGVSEEFNFGSQSHSFMIGIIHHALNIHQIITTKYSSVNDKCPLPHCWAALATATPSHTTAHHTAVPTKTPLFPSFRVACAREAELSNMADCLPHSGPTNIILRRQTFCRDKLIFDARKRMFYSNKTHVLSRQKCACRDKHKIFGRDKSFVKGSILLSRQKRYL